MHFFILNLKKKLATNGWEMINGKWYHFNKSGALSVSTKIGQYTVDANGEWIN